MFINVCRHLNFHLTSIHQLIRRMIKTQIQNKTPLDPIRRIANIFLSLPVYKVNVEIDPPQTPSRLRHNHLKRKTAKSQKSPNRIYQQQAQFVHRHSCCAAEPSAKPTSVEFTAPRDTSHRTYITATVTRARLNENVARENIT